MAAVGSAQQRALSEILRDWPLTLDAPPFTTPRAELAFVSRGGQAAVLKLCRAEAGELRAADVLRAYDGCGAVRVLEARGPALLLERAVPGTPLLEVVRSGDDVSATRILCDVAAALTQTAPPDKAFPTVEDWGQGFDRYLRAPDLRLPRALALEAQSVFAAACREQGPRYLLHGDLHHENVLDGGARGWLAIDPKGVVGEPAYEMGAALRKPPGLGGLCQEPEAMRSRVEIMCGRLGFAPQTVLRWCFSQAVLSVIWSIEDGEADGWIGQRLAVARTARALM